MFTRPKQCVIYVAKEYQGWQKTVLLKLQQLYNTSTNTLPENSEIVQALSDAELKPHFKKVMPFVQMLKETLAFKGAATLDTGVQFDEMAVLMAQREYLLNTLEVTIVRTFIASYCASYNLTSITGEAY